MVWTNGRKPISNSIKTRFDNLRTGPKLNQRQHAGRSDSSANQLTQRDLEELRAIYARNGESECQLRQDLQQVVNNRDYMVPVVPRASLCITLAGSCQVQVPSGSNCACYNAWGAVFPGIAD